MFSLFIIGLVLFCGNFISCPNAFSPKFQFAGALKAHPNAESDLPSVLPGTQLPANSPIEISGSNSRGDELEISKGIIDNSESSDSGDNVDDDEESSADFDDDDSENGSDDDDDGEYADDEIVIDDFDDDEIGANDYDDDEIDVVDDDSVSTADDGTTSESSSPDQIPIGEDADAKPASKSDDVDNDDFDDRAHETKKQRPSGRHDDDDYDDDEKESKIRMKSPVNGRSWAEDNGQQKNPEELGRPRKPHGMLIAIAVLIAVTSIISASCALCLFRVYSKYTTGDTQKMAISSTPSKLNAGISRLLGKSESSNKGCPEGYEMVATADAESDSVV